MSMQMYMLYMQFIQKKNPEKNDYFSYLEWLAMQ